MNFTASRQPYKPKPLKSVNKSNPDHQKKWLRQAQQSVNQWNHEQVNKEWLNQLAESARKQERQAKPKGLPRVFVMTPEVEEYYKKQEEAKHDAWNPPQGSEQFEKNQKKQPFGWLPEKKS